MTKFELEKFDGTNDFSLWRESLKGVLKIEFRDYSKGLWDKMVKLCLKPFVSNKINLLERLYGFRMNLVMSLDEDIDKFNEIIVGLENIEHKVNEESQEIILLRSLPMAYQEVKAAIKYSKDIISLDGVLGALKSKDFELKLEEVSKKDEA
ncbi:uncharacterized protein LOC133795564 [Humulus lupulus]|uniref:uncharacterized protein LOC133795564 n=1 Tax=Humulus lupulus TaxID=3486 RepID=UPI002B40603A|nr:uncharacterized protein LOC133795564 [Humulus lupulus]